MNHRHVESARALIGTRFRPQGRGERGLDCIGLVIAAFGLPADSARRDYRLRGAHRQEVEQGLGQYFRPIRKAQSRPGDLLLMLVASDQLHLGILTPTGFVHADARIGRVVETPGSPAWPIIGIYRRRQTAKVS